MKIWIILLIMSSLLISIRIKGQESAAGENAAIDTEIGRLIEKNGGSIYQAFFSIKELRPFSIIQFDRTADMYDNVFVTPEKFVSALTQEELDELKARITGYIMDFDVSKRAAILYKLGSWPVVDNHFTFIKSKYSVSETRLLESMVKVTETSNIFDSISKQGEFIISKISRSEKDEAYNNALNNVVSLTNNEQLNYYSKLYKELSIN